MNIHLTWRKKLRVVLWRLLGTLKCIVLQTHMIRVLKQNERIPNVVRCVGSPTHKYDGLVGVGVGALAVGLSIYL